MALPKVGFYHLTHWPLERALPKLLEKAVSSGLRVVVMAGSDERVAALDALLWTYEAGSWLPHGTAKDGDAPLQPIWITAKDENPGHADFLVLTDSVTSTRLPEFARCAMMFDGGDQDAVAEARRCWAEWKAAGMALAYHQQNERGGWELKMEVGASAPAEGGRE